MSDEGRLAPALPAEKRKARCHLKWVTFLYPFQKGQTVALLLYQSPSRCQGDLVNDRERM